MSEFDKYWFLLKVKVARASYTVLSSYVMILLMTTVLAANIFAGNWFAVPACAATAKDESTSNGLLPSPTDSTEIVDPKEIYGLSIKHEQNKVFKMRTLALLTLPVLRLARPLKLESEYDEPIDLDEALNYALMHNLPIKIARESWVYQRGQLGGQLAGFLPSFSSSWNLQQAKINTDTNADTRVFQNIIRYPVFQGGQVLYGSLVQYYRNEAFHANFNGTLNDYLLTVYQNYTNLVLNHALLHIRAKAVEVSRMQLELNNKMYQAGTGTAYAIMQARSQLAVDRQTLYQQQMNTRQAAVSLAFNLNLPMAVNLVPRDSDITEASLVDRKLSIVDLINLSLQHRPDLRLYELFRVSGARAVQVAASGLYPNVSLFNAYTRSSTEVTPIENKAALNGVANAVITSTSTTAGTANNTQLNQTASFSPGDSSPGASSITATSNSSGLTNVLSGPTAVSPFGPAALNQSASFTPGANNTGSSGANTGAASVVAASGGNPMNNIQSGNFVTSGAVAPSFGSLFNNAGIAPAANLSGTNTTGAGIFAGLTDTYQQGLNLTWSLPNLGSSSICAIIGVRALTREALHQANQELQYVAQQVHSDCISAYISSRQIDAASVGVDSSAEELRIAQLRFKSGVGTNLEMVQAERDYVNSLVTKVQAIVASNQAQAQLLHDIGVISPSTLEHGYTQ